MRNIILICAAVSGALIASPAAAQYYPVPNQNYANPYGNQGNHYGDAKLSARIGQLQMRLDAGLRTGTISRREARPIREQIRQLAMLESRYRLNGLSGHERADLEHRVRTVRQSLRRADDGGQGRYADWDREDGYGWNNQVNGRIDTNRDGWDDRDYNRNGRLDDDGAYGGQQYGYQQPARQGGIAGLIASVLGGGSVQIGQRAPTNLYAVPYHLQGQFRDGNGTYFRSDGRQIYQIDARTQTVVQIYAM